MKLLFHPATLFVLFNVGLAATAVWCWGRYQNKIVDPALTQLSAEKIEINTPPAWTKTDIKEAILTSTGQPRSLLEPSLISDAVATCQTIGWIEQVREMKKTREGLKVDLLYRQPIAVVELHSKTVPDWKQEAKLIPVDRTGVIMPQKLALAGTVQPKIFIYHSDETQKHAPQHLRHIYRWTQWPDERVKGAAAISEVLIGDWQMLGLSRIISWRLFANADDRTIPFELWTEEGENAATVIWGNAPGLELENEAPWDQKVAALNNYVQQKGPLNKLSVRIIDLRSGQAVEVGRASGLGHRRELDVR
ncbi:hypothetical protein [Mariniblastus fucicola]|nr:hypothetical protein [Mariniblastus fucicola]